jgi:transposase
MTTQIDDLSRSLVALEQDTTLIAAVELSQSSWLVGAMVPGLERRPQKKLEPDPSVLVKLLERWRDKAYQTPAVATCRTVRVRQASDNP